MERLRKKSIPALAKKTDETCPAKVVTPSQSPASTWPVLGHAALQGLPGEIVNTIAPETESDPVAILVQCLVAFGSAVGSGPYFHVDGAKHRCNLFACLVGESARARKGTSLKRVMELMSFADPVWCKCCTKRPSINYFQQSRML